jgi:hypothetical protein
VAVEAVTTSCQLKPAGVAAMLPDCLNMLSTIVPLIIFSYALIEYPDAAGPSCAVPTPVTSLPITPLLLTKLDIECQ